MPIHFGGPVGAVPLDLRSSAVEPLLRTTDSTNQPLPRNVSRSGEAYVSVLQIMQRHPYGTSVADALIDSDGFGDSGGYYAQVDTNPPPPSLFSANWADLRKALDALGGSPTAEKMRDTILEWIKKKLTEVKTKLADKSTTTNDEKDARSDKIKYWDANSAAIENALVLMFGACAGQGKATVLAAASDVLWLFYRFMMCSVGINRFIESLVALGKIYDAK